MLITVDTNRVTIVSGIIAKHFGLFESGFNSLSADGRTVAYMVKLIKPKWDKINKYITKETPERIANEAHKLCNEFSSKVLEKRYLASSYDGGYVYTYPVEEEEKVNKIIEEYSNKFTAFIEKWNII